MVDVLFFESQTYWGVPCAHPEIITTFFRASVSSISGVVAGLIAVSLCGGQSKCLVSSRVSGPVPSLISQLYS